MVPPTPSTAAAGANSPVAVTMTVSPVLADASGTPATGEPASAATIAVPATAIRRFFRPASRARQPAAAANDLAFGIRTSPPLRLLDPDDECAGRPLRWLRLASAGATWSSAGR